jgi:hypothetical protein
VSELEPAEPVTLETAAQLQADANAMWELSIGPHTPTSGFQVEPVERFDPATRELVAGYRSTLWGGRSLVGSASFIRRAMRLYVASRGKKGKE